MPANRFGVHRMRNGLLKQLPVNRHAGRAPPPAAAAYLAKTFLSTSYYHCDDLQRPSILYESNHLLVVNKPVGWHSVPNKEQDLLASSEPGNKCLLQFLIQHKLGGGSQRTFLKPLHRIDQPCSGVLLLGKTSRVASRIQSAWKDVKKTYLVVAYPPLALRATQHNTSSSSNNGEWQIMAGYMLRRPSPYNNNAGSATERHPFVKKNRGWSVTMIGADPSNKQPPRNLSEGQYRYCTLHWRCLTDRSLLPALPDPSSSSSSSRLLQIQTSQGARHMVRALLASHGWTVVGDGRYGNRHHNYNHNLAYLPDHSVALHAATLQLPTQLALGAADDEEEGRKRFFVAPIPDQWSQYFGITQSDVLELCEAQENQQHDNIGD